MLIIFTGEKDEKKQKTNKQNLFVEKKKKKKKRGEKNHLNVEELASCLVFCT